jgi:hypothetical protein
LSKAGLAERHGDRDYLVLEKVRKKVLKKVRCR